MRSSVSTRAMKAHRDLKTFKIGVYFTPTLTWV